MEKRETLTEDDRVEALGLLDETVQAAQLLERGQGPRAAVLGQYSPCLSS